jgi:hypothetical protein
MLKGTKFDTSDLPTLALAAQSSKMSLSKNSTPTLSPDRHTARHRRARLGGRIKVNSAGTVFVVEIDRHAPPTDKLFSMARNQGASSSNFSLTIRFCGSRRFLRRSTGKTEKRGKPMCPPPSSSASNRQSQLENYERGSTGVLAGVSTACFRGDESGECRFDATC